jgi:3-oxoacyl-[acyl-carrier protein] reductase
MTALVTGAASGIGAAIARRLLADGHEVVCLDRDAPAWTHDRLHAVRADLTDTAATQAAAAQIASKFAITRFIHNAGAIRAALLEDVALADLQALTALHLAAPLLLLQAVLPGMRDAGFGRVVLISSRAALGLQTRSAYSATKAGMTGMARTWALELAPSGITVNVVAPGPIARTAMFEAVVPPGSAREQAMAAAIPVGRLGTPDDVANAVAFFTSAGAGFVTGQTLLVCGGSSIGQPAL